MCINANMIYVPRGQGPWRIYQGDPNKGICTSVFYVSALLLSLLLPLLSVASLCFPLSCLIFVGFRWLSLGSPSFNHYAHSALPKQDDWMVRGLQDWRIERMGSIKGSDFIDKPWL